MSPGLISSNPNLIPFFDRFARIFIQFIKTVKKPIKFLKIFLKIFIKVIWLELDEIQPGLVLNLFLIFAKNPGWGSYKLGLGLLFEQKCSNK